MVVVVVGGGGLGAVSARADFNHRELLCYLSNTNQAYQILPLLLTFISEQDSVKCFIKALICGHVNLIFDAMFVQVLTSFLCSFLLINDLFKTLLPILCLTVEKSIFSPN